MSFPSNYSTATFFALDSLLNSDPRVLASGLEWLQAASRRLATHFKYWLHCASRIVSIWWLVLGLWHGIRWPFIYWASHSSPYIGPVVNHLNGYTCVIVMNSAWPSLLGGSARSSRCQSLCLSSEWRQTITIQGHIHLHNAKDSSFNRGTVAFLMVIVVGI